MKFRKSVAAMITTALVFTTLPAISVFANDTNDASLDQTTIQESSTTSDSSLDVDNSTLSETSQLTVNYVTFGTNSNYKDLSSSDVYDVAAGDSFDANAKSIDGYAVYAVADNSTTLEQNNGQAITDYNLDSVPSNGENLYFIYMTDADGNGIPDAVDSSVVSCIQNCVNVYYYNGSCYCYSPVYDHSPDGTYKIPLCIKHDGLAVESITAKDLCTCKSIPVSVGSYPITCATVNICHATDIHVNYGKDCNNNGIPDDKESTITYRYVDQNGTSIAPTTSNSQVIGTQISLNAPSIQGYTYDHTLVNNNINYNSSVTVGSSNMTIQYCYTENPKLATVITSYIDTSGNQIAQGNTRQYYMGQYVSINPINIPGYTYNYATVNGYPTSNSVIFINDPSTKAINYVYSKDAPQPQTSDVTFKYFDKDGNKLKAAKTSTYSVGDVIDLKAPKIDGYIFTNVLVNGSDYTANTYTVTADDATIKYVYDVDSNGDGIPDSQEVTVTVKYKDTTGAKIADTTTTLVPQNSSYSLSAPTISGYTYKETTVDGTATTKDKTKIGTSPVTVIYTYSCGC